MLKVFDKVQKSNKQFLNPAVKTILFKYIHLKGDHKKIELYKQHNQKPKTKSKIPVEQEID